MTQCTIFKMGGGITVLLTSGYLYAYNIYIVHICKPIQWLSHIPDCSREDNLSNLL